MTPPARALELADELQRLHDLVRWFPERRAGGFVDLLELRNKVPDTVAFLRSLSPPSAASGEVAEAKPIECDCCTSPAVHHYCRKCEP